MPTTLSQSDLPGLELIHRGKVRDVYALPGNRLLMVATDRLSAFDVILHEAIHRRLRHYMPTATRRIAQHIQRGCPARVAGTPPGRDRRPRGGG